MTRATKSNRGLARHLDGWEPGLLAVLIAGSVAIVASPRAAPPDVLPEPAIDLHALARTAEADVALAKAAKGNPLDAEVRALGDAFHRYNTVVLAGGSEELGFVRRTLAASAARALAIDAHGTLELRAVELEAFVAAAGVCGGAPIAPTPPAVDPKKKRVARPDPVQESCARLRELAGIYAAREPSFRRALAADEPALRAYFKSYWSETTGMYDGGFAMSRDEVLAGLRFGLRHPRVAGGPAIDDSMLAKVARHRAASGVVLRKIDEISAVDPKYPRFYARGVVYYDMGEYPHAAESFRTYLQNEPDGALALRAQNNLLESIARATEP